MTAQELFAKLLEHNRLRDNRLRQYSAARTYKVTNDKGKIYGGRERAGGISGTRSQDLRRVGNSLPVGRVGEARDVAQAYLFLMLEEFATGQTVVVDGGTVLV
jgi:NAD(P)-dependent dehydrogenase (short-subunit alcohol dehydrogenase family)